jgi:anti-sigma28 factor (negative regulator of flagellin synthesis)
MGTENRQAPAKNVEAALRNARIAELRRQYRDGAYKVDAQALSAKIIDSHLRR